MYRPHMNLSPFVAVVLVLGYCGVYSCRGTSPRVLWCTWPCQETPPVGASGRQETGPSSWNSRKVSFISANLTFSLSLSLPLSLSVCLSVCLSLSLSLSHSLSHSFSLKVHLSLCRFFLSVFLHVCSAFTLMDHTHVSLLQMCSDGLSLSAASQPG